MPPRTGGVNTPQRCESVYAGKPYGYRLHIQRRRTDPDHLICADCRNAARLAQQAYAKSRILNGAKTARKNSRGTRLVGGHLMGNPAGTRRRLQALWAIGWSLGEIGRRLGTHKSNVRHIIESTQWTMPKTRDKVIALYNELSMIAPPQDDGHVKAVKTLARRAGAIGPLCWDDAVIDDPYAIPVKEAMTRQQIWDWYWLSATDIEKVSWVLAHGRPENPRSGKRTLAWQRL